MPHTTYTMKRTNVRTWVLVANRGECKTYIDESSTVGATRARIEFERKHRIAVEYIDPVTDNAA